MSIYRLKPAFQGLLRPFVGRLASAGITANQVTVLACLGSVGLGAWLLIQPRAAMFALVPLWMLLRMALNAIDGMLAREHGQISALGGYLNELGDVISDAALYLPFALIGATSPILVAIVIALAITSELAGVLSVRSGASRRYDGPMGKSDRAVVFGVIGLLYAVGVPVAAWLDWVWGAMALAIGLTIANRVRGGLHENKG